MMRRSFLNMLLVAGCLSVVISGLSMWLGTAAARAQGQPPPRPTLTPALPTRHSSHASPTAVPAGRITGTVIDQTTGAPAPNIAVVVGDQIVMTDANGNYDRNGLPAGSYTIALKLAAGQGVAAQEPVVIALAPGATVIQHLAFHSPAPIVPTPTVAAAPTRLPTTGGADGGAWFAFALGVLMISAGLGMRRGCAG
jgi:hypothetical protein